MFGILFVSTREGFRRADVVFLIGNCVTWGGHVRLKGGGFWGKDKSSSLWERGQSGARFARSTDGHHPK